MSKPSPRALIAYQALRQAIIEQALMPGTKLPEDQIGAHFRMSRTLVRATLARLGAEGLVEMRHKRTATVAQPTLEEAKEVFEARRALEREVVRLVVMRWQPRFGAELEGHVRQEDAARTRGDERISIRLAGEFHMKLAAMAGNAVLERFLAEMVSRCSLILALYGRPHSSECAVNEHLEIVEALRQGDAERAIHLMDHHIGSVERRALISELADAAPELGSILARYSDPLEAQSAAVPLKPKARRRGP